MANWFEDNPTKSVISYTLIIAGATWAVSTFVLQDNRLNLARSELEAQKSLTEQYKSKADLLQRDIEALRTDNSEYRTWLGQTKDAIPAIVPRIAELKQQIATLQASTSKAVARSESPNFAAQRKATARLGTAYVDESTGLVLSVHKVLIDRTAQVSVKFPGRDATVEASIAAGQQWPFEFKGTKFLLTVTAISFVGDFVDFQVDTVP